MLDYDSFINEVAKRIDKEKKRQYGKYYKEIEIIGDILRNSKTIGQNQTNEINRRLDNVVLEIEKTTNRTTEKDIKKYMVKLTDEIYTDSKKYFDYRGIKQIPLTEQKVLQDIARLNLQNAMQYKGYTLSIEDTKTVINNVILKMSTGVGFEQAYNEIVESAVYNGIKVKYPSGVMRELYSVVRQNTLGAITQAFNEQQQELGKQFQSDGIELSAHASPAPDHAPLQGKQYTIEEYKKETDSLRRGIGEKNCYHVAFSIIMGVSTPANSEQELKKYITNNEKGVEYNGKHYTIYEMSQKQRALESKIRKTKAIVNILKNKDVKIPVDKYNHRIKKYIKEYKHINNIADLSFYREKLQNRTK